DIGCDAALQRKAEPAFSQTVENLDPVKVFEQGRPVIPRHASRSGGDVVAESGRHRDRLNRGVAQAGGKSRKRGRDVVERALFKTDKVHFIDSKHNLPKPKERTNEGMPPSLR